MAAPVTRTCDTCSGIFTNHQVPAMYARYSWKKESYVHYLWRKTAQDLQSSIASGCSMCKALHRYFQIGYLKSHLYNRTGDIKLCFAYLKLADFHLGIFPEKEDAIPPHSWLSYKLVAASDVDPCAAFVPGRPLHHFTASDNHFKTVNGWLNVCRNIHAKCNIRKPNFMPSRVLELWLDDNTPSVRLVSGEGRTVPYAALSYCWGVPNFMTTTTRKLADFMQLIPASQLPKTIQDAIKCSRRLGIRYLWVDALCIVQDSVGEKAREISIMGQIYQHAEVTISAAIAQDSGEGFLYDRKCAAANPGDSIPYLPFHCGNGVIGTVGLLKLSETNFRDPIVSRGWTFQEHMLSRRLLIYGTLGVYWQCLEDREPEGEEEWDGAGRVSKGWAFQSRLALHGSQITVNDAIKSEVEEWEKIVEEYSIRALTNSRDKLPALSAIAAAFGRPSSEYAAGLWLSWLPRLLLWKVPKPEKAVRLLNVAPSWSWASLASPVVFLAENYQLNYGKAAILEGEATTKVPGYPTLGPYSDLIKVLEYSTIPKYDFAPYGELAETRLVIRGRVKLVHADMATAFAEKQDNKDFYVDWPEPYEGFYPDTLEEFRDTTEPFFTMPIARIKSFVVGLLLRGSLRKFQRVGIHVESLVWYNDAIDTHWDLERIELI